MLSAAVLSEDPKTKKLLTIGDFIARDDIVTNHEAGADKPARGIYEFAARKLGVAIDECLFLGENLVENLGAAAAGMANELKPCPPGREFQPALQGKLGGSSVDSGRQFEAFLEHEHLLGERIFAGAERIAELLHEMTLGKEPPLDQEKWISPKDVGLPEPLERALAYYMHLIDHFADPVHFRAEEAMLEVAIATGMAPQKADWVFNQHDQARAYWAAMDVAWRRIRRGDADDRFYAYLDMECLLRGFVRLFKAHAVRENDQMYPEAGARFSDSDDALVLNLIEHSGPSDITPYIGMVERMELLLGLSGS